MTAPPFISIDQNCQPLWDTIPKLQALAAHGRRGTHYLEDIDVAFSRQGVHQGDPRLELMRERIYRGGHSDWGAALFAHDFLGRLPLDVRDLEPFTGHTTAALSRLLQTDVDELYDRWSPSDNWQLVGASYADTPGWHRVIGDVRVREAAPFVRELLAHARADLLARFPETPAQERVNRWFAEQEALVEPWLTAAPNASLTDLYRQWLQASLPDGVSLSVTSAAFSLQRSTSPDSLLTRFISHYQDAAEAYNQALQDTGVGMAPLHTDKGELPFFVIQARDGHMQRTAMSQRDGWLLAADTQWPLTEGRLAAADLQRHGVIAVAGKALVLVLQARTGPDAGALALPHLGSLYMPAAYAFERRLRERGLLTAPVCPVWRVRLHFLDAWHACRTLVRPPPYLAQAIGIDEAPANEVAEAIAAAVAAAEKTLDQLRDEHQRQRLVAGRFAEPTRRRNDLETRRRDLARDPARRGEAQDLWQEIKQIDREVAEAHAEWVVQLRRTIDVGYYDSRGALLPWALALGDETLYRTMLAGAEIATEDAAAAGALQPPG